MIYLQQEIQQFIQTKQLFETDYISLLEQMLDTYKNKGAIRDTTSPIHHRMSPMQMLGLLQAKSRRVDSILSEPNWEKQLGLLDKVIEECCDIANYALFTATLCSLLKGESCK